MSLEVHDSRSGFQPLLVTLYHFFDPSSLVLITCLVHRLLSLFCYFPGHSHHSPPLNDPDCFSRVYSRYRPDVAQRVGRVIALLFHDRGTRRGWVVSVTPRPHFTPRKDPVPILQEAGWAPGPVWTGGKSRPHRDSISGHLIVKRPLWRPRVDGRIILKQIFKNSDGSVNWIDMAQKKVNAVVNLRVP